ncbi:hypothetical protein HELRODRAFT_185002 [Helobdella robusta]|uniref:peptidylprolyl isomerase n=1 Tax=Helobdella robusta TaxID=6412 RepID=T1FM94_HELRO|nr:hypothetical protein HELRODRAFT_185002 [Helobdella robusta]ESO02599.1 hypothetical protein HELRODRAFT_185002 [Helobdella robusta]
MGEENEKLAENMATSQVYSPGPNSVDVSINKDGGVLKEILKEGEGTEHPLTGDMVSVHYVGKLPDGTVFDSSRDRGDLFEFNLGKGTVIKAWDQGVATMKKGELAILYCTPDYGYGKSGSPPKIPPNSPLVFEVELFDWKGEDVSEGKDEGVLKSTFVAGEGYQTPRDGATCDVHIIGLLNGVEFENRDVTFTVGEACESGIVDGLEMAITKMKKGEKAKLNIKSKYAYAAEGNSQLNIPPSADLEYHVELKKFEKSKESWELDADEKLEQSEICKTKGTNFFKENKYKLALRYYKKIVDYLKSEDTLQGESAEKRKSLLLAAHLNEALCHLKLKEDLEAFNSCNEALTLDPKNEKGLFRRATAQHNLQNFQEAIQDFKLVLEVDPENKAAKNQITLISQKLKAIYEKEKKTYAGMFAKFAEADSKKQLETKSSDENLKKESDANCCGDGDNHHKCESGCGSPDEEISA